MPLPKVEWLGIDLISEGFTDKIPDITERKTWKRDKIITGDFSIKCRNINNTFTEGNSRSIVNNIDWLYSNLTVYDSDNIKIWDGIVTDISCNHRTKEAIISCKDNLFGIRKEFIEYESDDWETPAEAIYNIFTDNNFSNYDITSIQASIINQENESIYCKININISDKISMFSAIEDIGFKSACDVYTHLGNIYVKYWKKFTGGISLFLNNSSLTRLKSAPIVNFLESEMVNQYSIDYEDSDTPAVDSDITGIGRFSRLKPWGTQSLEPFDTGNNKKIIYRDSTAAQAVGENYINRTNYNILTNPRPIKKIQFDLDNRFTQYIDINSYFALTLEDENWIDKKFEVMEYRRNEDNRNINIIAYEVIE